MGFLEMILGTNMSAEGTYLFDFLLINQFELRHRRCLTLIFIEKSFSCFFMFLRIDMMPVGLWRQKLLGANITVNLVLTLTLRGKLRLKFYIKRIVT